MNSRVRLLMIVAVVIGVIQFVWYVVPVMQEGFGDSAFGFLIAFCLPFLVGAALLPRFRRTGAAILGLFSLLLAIVSVIVIVGGPSGDWKWMDYLSVYVAGPLAIVAVVLSVMVLATRKTADVAVT